MRLIATESSIDSKSPVLCKLQPLLPSLESSAPRGLGEHILIWWDAEKEYECMNMYVYVHHVLLKLRICLCIFS